MGFHDYIKNRKEVIAMEGKPIRLFEMPRLVEEMFADRNENIECCCHEACYGLVLGRYEYDSRCCR